MRHDYFSSFNQLHHCFLASSLLKFPTSAGATCIRFDNNDGVRLKAVYRVQWGLLAWLKWQQLQFLFENYQQNSTGSPSTERVTDYHTGNAMSTLFSNSVCDLWCSTQELWGGDSIGRYYYKGSTFSSVIKGPCLLVKPGIWTRNILCARLVCYQLSQAVGGWYVSLIVHFKPQKLTPPWFYFLNLFAFDLCCFVEFSCYFLAYFSKGNY